jgi:hypothetical protein
MVSEAFRGARREHCDSVGHALRKDEQGPRPFGRSPRRRVGAHEAKASAMAKARTTKPKSWTVHLVRKRGELLGVVYAADKAVAVDEAVREFNLTVEQRKRLIVSEC